MKKYIYSLIFLLMALVSVGFASCGDDEPKGSDIVGTWQRKIVGIGGGADMILLQFTKDGKYHEANSYIVNDVDKVDVYHGTYTVSGNKLTVTYIYTYETEIVKCTYQVKGDKLTITSEDGASTFIRVEDSVIEPYLQNI